VRKCWKQILFFGAITAYFIVGIAPDMTWLSQAGDQFDYVIGAENMWAVRPTGYPAYILLGWLFERLPTNPFWNLGLFSALTSVVTCIYIFLTIKFLNNSTLDLSKVKTYFEGRKGSGMTLFGTYSQWSKQRFAKSLAPYIGALTYASSFLVWTQSVIPEVYSLTTLVMVMAVYYALKGRWYIAAMVLAVSVGTHHIVVFTMVPLLGYLLYQRRKGLTTAKPWMCIGLVFLGFLTYLQTQLCVVGQETTSGLDRVLMNSLGTLSFLYTLPIKDTLWRLGEFLPMLLTSVGIGGILPFFLILLHKRNPEVPRGPR